MNKDKKTEEKERIKRELIENARKTLEIIHSKNESKKEQKKEMIGNDK